MNLKRIDAHSHVSFEAYREDGEQVIARSLEEGTGMIAVGTRLETSKSSIAVAERHDGVWATVGLHPTHLHGDHVDLDELPPDARPVEQFDVSAYRELARSSGKVVAIGECGLDYFHLPKDGTAGALKELQKEAFREQLYLASGLDLPVMLHVRDAHDDVADIIEELQKAGERLRGNVHCFTGTMAEAQRYLALGFLLSFTGVVTYPPRAADRDKPTLMDVAKALPLDRIMVETDAPYLSPVPHRGKRNEPAWVRDVAAAIAAARGMDVDAFEAQVLANTKALFRLQ